MYRLDSPQTEDLKYIADNMRPEDVAEIEASGVYPSPFVALQKSVLVSRDTWVAKYGEEPLCVFGVGTVKLMSTALGFPWLLSTPAVEKHPGALLRIGRWHVERALKTFDILENYIDARNTKAIGWLRWLGFSFDASPVLVGPGRTPFLRFSKARA